jgi:hypothetical protein
VRQHYYFSPAIEHAVVVAQQSEADCHEGLLVAVEDLLVAAHSFFHKKLMLCFRKMKKMYKYWQLTCQNVFGCAVFFSYSVGLFLLKGQTMHVYTRRHVFLRRSPHPRKTCADTLSSHVCLDTHELCVSVRQRCFQGAPTT